ncbi:MAG: ribonuclease HII [bacterium]|nr:ribonuclease HII [bacterium]
MVIGIDEVGRGPLAGPVVVACVALPDSFNDLFTNHYSLATPSPLRDSKKLTAIQRTAWNTWIRTQPTIRFCIARSTPRTIDSVNISQAANRAAYRAYKKVMSSLPTTHYPLPTLLDAGIKLPKTIPQKAIIKGDEKIPAIALASILAKVARDDFMERMHKRYPAYNFKENKGYGTAVHIKALKRHGPCPLHRLTFIKNLVILKAT